MAKTPEERPAVEQIPDVVAIPETPRRRSSPTPRYNPSPGYRLLVAEVNGYGERLPEPNMKAFPLTAARGMTDQAEYLLTLEKPKAAKASEWWREATPDEMAAYQESTGAFGEGPLAEELRADWKARHPKYHEGPPEPPTTEGERVLKRLADALEKREREQR